MRRLSIVQELVADGGLKIHPHLVKSVKNKADILAKVCVKWLKHPTVCSALSTGEVRDRHNNHHFGFKKTKYFIQAENEETFDSVIRKVSAPNANQLTQLLLLLSAQKTGREWRWM